MLNMSVKTKLDRSKAVDQAVTYFSEDHGLSFVEARAHLHGANGAVELGVIGTSITGDDPNEWRSVLNEEVDHMKNDRGLGLEYYVLHFHSGVEGQTGHLLVQINDDDDRTVNFESHEVDEITRAFANKIAS